MEKANEATLGDYRSASGQRHTKLEGLLSNHVEIQNDYCSQERTRIDAATDRRAEERSQLTSSYAETVSKLINVSMASEHYFKKIPQPFHFLFSDYGQHRARDL